MAEASNPTLNTFFSPRSIAIIGASSDINKPGNIILKHILAMGYKGQIFPVNPREERILDLPCYKSVLDIPHKLDLAVLLLPADAALDVANQLAERKKHVRDISGVVCVSAGFSELNNEEGRSREIRLVQLLRSVGVRLIGPNCMGIMDTRSGVNTNFDISTYPKGGVSIITQSGAFGSAFLMWSKGRSGVGLSKFVSLGNMADVDMTEVLKYLKEDQQTRVIGIYLEGHPDPRHLLETVRDVSLLKPVVVLKVGRTELGSGAALSHTGAVAGSNAIYDGALRQVGAIRVRTVPEFYDTLRAFERQPLPKGKGVFVLTHIGGPGTICVDEISTLPDLGLARISEEGKESLRKLVAPTATVCRPEGYVDMTAAHHERLHHEVLKILFSEDSVSLVIQIMAPSSFLSQQKLAEEIVTAYLSQPTGLEKPLLNVIMYGSSAEECRKVLEKAGLPTFDFPDIAARVASNMSRYAEKSQMIKTRSAAAEFSQKTAADAGAAKLSEVISAARAEGRTLLLEPEAYEACRIYGISVPSYKLITDPDEGLRAAAEIGYPVVLKIVSPDVVHKTEVGGVILEIHNDQEFHENYQRILKNLKQRAPQARVTGILVQKSLPSTAELAVGGLRDEQFGPVVMFGLGGVYVEALREVSFRLCPFTAEEAKDLIQESTAFRLLRRLRGGRAADIDSITHLLVVTGQLIADNPTIEQLDLNPVLSYSDGYKVVDARIILSQDSIRG